MSGSERATVWTMWVGKTDRVDRVGRNDRPIYRNAEIATGVQFV